MMASFDNMTPVKHPVGASELEVYLAYASPDNDEILNETDEQFRLR